MKKNSDRVFLVAIFALCSLVQMDLKIAGMDLKMVLMISVTLVFLSVKLAADKGFQHIQADHIDIAVYASGALALTGMLHKVILGSGEYEKYMTLLSLCLLYFAARNYLTDLSPDLVFLGSIFGAVISIPLLYHYTVDAGFVKPVQALIQDGGSIPWLVLMITINVLGYCTYDGRGMWYGANAVVGFFLLFLQNNAAAVIITGAMFLQTALRYMAKPKNIRRIMQMFFAYAFLLCNMALITNYTNLLVVKISYDLELSVYMELVLAVFAVWFFSTWDRCTGEGDKENMALPQFRCFFRQTAVIAGIAITGIAVAVVRGKNSILPGAAGRLTALCRDGIGTQTGMLETAAALYGIAGVALAGYFMYSVLERLRKNRLLKTSRHRKLFRVMSWVFVVQALFLTQSMASLPVYIIFVAVMLNEQHMNGDGVAFCQTGQLQECHHSDGADVTTELVREESTDEADHSDSMLQ